MTCDLNEQEVKTLLNCIAMAVTDMRARMQYCASTTEGKRRRAVWLEAIRQARELAKRFGHAE